MIVLAAIDCSFVMKHRRERESIINLTLVNTVFMDCFKKSFECFAIRSSPSRIY